MKRFLFALPVVIAAVVGGASFASTLAQRVSFRAMPVLSSMPGADKRTPVSGQNLFFQTTSYSAGSQANWVAVADLNKDGIPDLVVTNPDSTSVSVLLGNGDGTFKKEVQYPTGEWPVGVVIADFNGDGNLDLAVTAYKSGAVDVLLGNGDGTFQHYIISTVSFNPFSPVTADFNGDGIPDIAVLVCANVGCGGNFNVAVMLGNGDGSFGPQTNYAAGQYATALATADFNRDGLPDLAAVNECGAGGCNARGSVGIYLGKGNGTFKNAMNNAAGYAATSVAVADFNHDGKLDLAVADSCSVPLNNGCSTSTGVYSILLGNGDGTFQAHQDYTTGKGNLGVVTAADFSGDGHPDLAFTAGKSVKVVLGNGDGTFQAPLQYSVTNPYWILAADLNGGGRRSYDLAVPNFTSNTVSVLLNESSVHITLGSSPNPSQEGQSVTFTANVSAAVQGLGVPTGAVTFASGNNFSNANVVNGVATLTMPINQPGTYSVTATYTGDVHFNPRRSTPIIQTVNQ